MKNAQTIIFILMGSLILAACQKKQPSRLDLEMEKALPELERKAGQFDPSLAIKPGLAHRAVSVKQNPDGTYQIISIGELRKGVLPYGIDKEVNKKNLGFTVRWMGDGGKYLGSYTIEHPLNSRSCEDGTSKVRRSALNQFEVLIPADQNIRMIELGENGNSYSRLALKIDRPIK